MRLTHAWCYSTFSRGGLDKFLVPERRRIGEGVNGERGLEENFLYVSHPKTIYCIGFTKTHEMNNCMLES